MDRSEMIETMLALDNVGMLDGINFDGLTDLEIEKLFREIEEYAQKRMQAFVKEFDQKNTKR